MTSRSKCGRQGSTHQCLAALPIPVLRNLENEIRLVAGNLAGQQPLAFNAADLGHGALRAPVLVADPEDHGIDEAEGVVEHQPLDLAIGRAAPVAADNKSPADLDFAALGVIAMVAARADQ